MEKRKCRDDNRLIKESVQSPVYADGCTYFLFYGFCEYRSKPLKETINPNVSPTWSKKFGL